MDEAINHLEGVHISDCWIPLIDAWVRFEGTVMYGAGSENKVCILKLDTIVEAYILLHH
jgi:hypothetical protein